MMSTSTSAILTVSQLTHQARLILEQGFPMVVVVTGEISNFSSPGSGHWYFTLKDHQAQIRCAMFRNRNQLSRYRPRNGEQVNLYCRISLYEPRGDFQVIGERIEPAGLGSLQQAFEQLQQRLGAEGLFAQQHKQPIPTQPQQIGVITSPTGAAVRDILTVLKRRCPAIPVELFPVAVQGNEAAGQIVRAIQLANQLNQCDVLIVGRGGGSLEDLWPFNEEIVARAIFASRIPVISAVGHETDVTISDFVADLRAPTPSAAAELVAPDQQVWEQRLTQLQRRLRDGWSRQLRSRQHLLQQTQRRLRDPRQYLHTQKQRLDNYEQRLQRLQQRHHAQLRQRLQQLQHRLEFQAPARRLDRQRQQLQDLQQRLQRSISDRLLQQQQRVDQLTMAVTDSGNKKISTAQEQLRTVMQQLHLVSPLATLERGYAILQDERGQVIRRASEVREGNQLLARLAEGQLHLTVDKNK
nr:exodeoxyribonuclease VII large subunit [Pokkaliibacter plantistimulans]